MPDGVENEMTPASETRPDRGKSGTRDAVEAVAERARAAMRAMAGGHIEAGRLEQMRSLVKPVPIRASG